jgi:hypothetical protein
VERSGEGVGPEQKRDENVSNSKVHIRWPNMAKTDTTILKVPSNPLLAEEPKNPPIPAPKPVDFAHGRKRRWAVEVQD